MTTGRARDFSVWRGCFAHHPRRAVDGPAGVSGTTLIDSGGTLILSGTASRTLTDRILDNLGDMLRRTRACGIPAPVLRTAACHLEVHESRLSRRGQGTAL